MNRRSMLFPLRRAIIAIGGWLRREPIGALGLLTLLFWSVVAVGAIGDGNGWLGIGRYDPDTNFQKLNPEFVHVKVAAALKGESAEISSDELQDLLADPAVYGPFADAAGVQPQIQDYVQPLIADGSLLPLLESGRSPYIAITDGEIREAQTGRIRDTNRPLTPAALEGPSAQHWFGTDRVGRDIYARVIDSAWHGLLVGFLAALLGVSGGVLVSLVARPISRGQLGGALDSAVRTLLDGLLALPLFLLLLLVVAVQGPTTLALALPLASFALPMVWRAFRDEPHSEDTQHPDDSLLNHAIIRPVRERAPTLIRIFRDVMVIALLCDAALSFLGFGPAGGSWGYLLSTGQQFLIEAPWQSLITGLALTSVLLGVIAFTHGLGSQTARSTR